MKPAPELPLPAELGLFGAERAGSITPIALELQAHFERGGSRAEGVRLVALLERAGARAAISKSRAKESRGSRLPANWQPSHSEVAFAVDRGMPETRVSAEAEKFSNFWSAKSGAGATKRDWSATWRNWIITTMERSSGLTNYRGKSPRANSPSGRAATGSDAILAGMGRLARRIDERRGISNETHTSGMLDFEPNGTRRD
jgi:hypothetical protein